MASSCRRGTHWSCLNPTTWNDLRCQPRQGLDHVNSLSGTFAASIEEIAEQSTPLPFQSTEQYIQAFSLYEHKDMERAPLPTRRPFQMTLPPCRLCPRG